MRLHPQTNLNEGDVTINGGLYDRATLKRVAGYVVQDDLLFASLTVYETLLVSSILCTSSSCTLSPYTPF
jgi:ABC-type multidrug transport system ATPase subunit